VIAAGVMGLIAYFLSYRAIFFAAAALVIPLLAALGRIRSSDIHFGRASYLPNHQAPSAPPRARLRSLSKKPQPAHIRRLRVLVPDGERVYAATRR
jgi:hypothetical protein